jgi:hypothetical protein
VYLAFLGESGETGLRRANPEYPVFALAAVVCLERDYTTRIDRQFKQFKATQLGSPDTILKPRALAKQQGAFAPLSHREKRRQFSHALSELITTLPVTVMVAVLNKEMHRREYGASERNAYSFALPFVMERLVYLMTSRHDGASTVAQIRGPREDAALRVVWLEHLAGGSYYHAATEFSSRLVKLDFRNESDNSTGLQLAGLAASACARFVLDPEQPHATYAALSPKLYQGTFTEPDRFGLKVIP